MLANRSLASVPMDHLAETPLHYRSRARNSAAWSHKHPGNSNCKTPRASSASTTGSADCPKVDPMQTHRKDPCNLKTARSKLATKAGACRSDRQDSREDRSHSDRSRRLRPWRSPSYGSSRCCDRRSSSAYAMRASRRKDQRATSSRARPPRFQQWLLARLDRPDPHDRWFPPRAPAERLCPSEPPSPTVARRRA